MPPGLDVVQYAGANARVRGLWSYLLDAETWRHLIAADTLDDALTLLRGTPYAEVLTTTEGRSLNIEGIEHRLLGRAAENCRKCMTFLRGASRTLLLVWWQHFELENLKALFRGVQQGMERERIAALMMPLGDYSTLPWEALLDERSVSGLVDRLVGTHYINPLRNAFSAYEREQSTFPLEVALDIRYYRDLYAAIKKLDAAGREEAHLLLGTYLDILNILWAFRYRVYYGMSAEEIVNYTIWHTFHTDVALIRSIALGATPIEVIQRVWGTHAVDYSPLMGLESAFEMMPMLETVLLRYWYRLARQMRHGFPFRIGVILAYLILEELEILDLVRILEAKRIGWTPERIRAHLIRVEE